MFKKKFPLIDKHGNEYTETDPADYYKMHDWRSGVHSRQEVVGYQPDHFARKIVPLTEGIDEVNLHKFEVCRKTEKELNRTIKCISCDEIECPNNGNIKLQSEMRHEKSNNITLERGRLRGQLKLLRKKMSFDEFLKLTVRYKDVIDAHYNSLKRCPHCGEVIE